MNRRNSLRVETLAGTLRMAASSGLPLADALDAAAEFLIAPRWHERILIAIIYWTDYLLIWTGSLPLEPRERPGPHRLIQFFPSWLPYFLYHLGLSATAFQAALRWAARDVRDGERLATALKRYSSWLPGDFLQVLDVGQDSGALAELLPLVSKQLSRGRVYRHYRRTSLAILLLYGFMIFSIFSGLMIFIVPKFAKMFDEMLAGEPLPFITNIVVGASNLVIKRAWIVVFPGVIGFVACCAVLHFLPDTRRILTAALCRLPFLGRLPRLGRIQACSTCLGACLRRGMPLEQSVELVLAASWDLWTCDFLSRFSDDLRDGVDWDRAWRDQRVGTPFSDWLVANGAARENPADAFDAVSEHLQSKLDQSVEVLTALSKPALVLPLALVVGCCALGMFLPLVKLIDALGGG